MDKNKNCSACNIKSVCRDCYNKKKRKNNLIQQPKIENDNN